MSTVVALFADEGSARAAADRLVQSGIPTQVVHLHRQGERPHNAGGVIADEYASGGFFNNFANLLDGLLGTSRPPGSVATYADVIRHEGVAVSVDGDAASTARAEALLRAAGAQKISSSVS